MFLPISYLYTYVSHFYTVVGRIPQMTAADEGVYRCTVNNGKFMVFSNKRVSFECTTPTDVTIAGPKLDNQYSLGTSIVWKCEAEGDPTPSYNWYKNGRLMSRGAQLM